MTCHVWADEDRVWTRLLELAADPDPRVRGDVIHAIADSTPALWVPAVLAALQVRHNDPDVGIRRHVRKTLARYRWVGKVTDAALWPVGGRAWLCWLPLGAGGLAADRGAAGQGQSQDAAAAM